MLKFEFDQKKGTTFEASGTGLDISAEVLLLIRIVYRSYQKETDGMNAEAFRSIIKRAIDDDLPFIDPDELHDKAEKAKSCISEKELSDIIRGVLEDILCS